MELLAIDIPAHQGAQESALLKSGRVQPVARRRLPPPDGNLDPAGGARGKNGGGGPLPVYRFGPGCRARLGTGLVAAPVLPVYLAGLDSLLLGFSGNLRGTHRRDPRAQILRGRSGR